MAEFQEVMRQINRMCLSHKNCSDSGCPLFDDCGNIGAYASSAKQSVRIEKTVMDWAAEHPEPVYPTWLEWLEMMGIVFYKPISETESRATVFGPEAIKPIPADIAEKLGIDPINK